MTPPDNAIDFAFDLVARRGYFSPENEQARQAQAQDRARRAQELARVEALNDPALPHALYQDHIRQQLVCSRCSRRWTEKQVALLHPQAHPTRLTDCYLNIELDP